ncbi:MAG: zinc-dependent alcohol dehydrogenase family protein [Candidatus Bathyarchaeia archaeon]
MRVWRAISLRAAYIERPYSIRVIEAEKPTPGLNEILVKVEACGVCGTDIHIYEGEAGIAKYPLIPGHEFSGRVVEAGADASKYVSVGERVAVDPTVTCGHCTFCRSGRKHFCREWSPIGVVRDGAFAEYVKVPAQLAHKIPSNISFEAAALTEPLSCCIHGWERISPNPGFTTVILGAGPIGLMHLQLAKVLGASLTIISEPMEFRRKLAEKFGADIVVNPLGENLQKVVYEVTSGLGADVVIEAVGGSKYLEEALRIAGPGGKILVFGVAPERDLAPISPYTVYRRELTILGSFINPYSMDKAVSLIASGRIDVKSLISHTISLENLEKALKREIEKPIKIIVKP